MKKMKFTKSAFNYIKDTVGSLPCETGGILLGNRKDMIVRKFILDKNGSTSYGAYDPDTDFLNSVIKKEWKENKLELIGFVHSHPPGVRRLSGDYGNNTGDVGYLKAIFKAIPALKNFLTPIVFSAHDTAFEMLPFVAEKGKEKDYYKVELEVVSDSIVGKKTQIEKNNVGLPDVSRLKGAVDINLMRNTTILGIGVGGAMGIYENLVRSGLENIIVIDFDRIDNSNITTQGYFADEVGMLKTKALEKRLKRINSKVKVTIINADFLQLSEKKLNRLAKRSDIVLMMTDDFYCQARGNRLAIKHRIPAIFAMMYEKARCSEIMFTIPNVTPGCFRCAVSSRYNAYIEDHYKNDVKSTGSTIFHTQYLNSTIGLIALAILHNKTEGFEFSNWFGKYWDRNFVQVRTHPKYGHNSNNLFDRLYNNNHNAFVFDSVWQKIEPESKPKYQYNCPDCGGLGDINALADNIKDTHIIKDKF